MIVEEFNKICVANNLSELEMILCRRQPGNMNAFWLSTESGGIPTLGILVKGDHAVLHYLPAADEPGFRSLGEMNTGEIFHFSISPNSADDVQEPSDAVLPFEAALKAAKEFFDSCTLPRSVKWIEL